MIAKFTFYTHILDRVSVRVQTATTNHYRGHIRIYGHLAAHVGDALLAGEANQNYCRLVDGYTIRCDDANIGIDGICYPHGKFGLVLDAESTRHFMCDGGIRSYGSITIVG